MQYCWTACWEALSSLQQCPQPNKTLSQSGPLSTATHTPSTPYPPRHAPPHHSPRTPLLPTPFRPFQSAAAHRQHPEESDIAALVKQRVAEQMGGPEADELAAAIIEVGGWVNG